jgi:hypothetical protein
MASSSLLYIFSITVHVKSTCVCVCGWVGVGAKWNTQYKPELALRTPLLLTVCYIHGNSKQCLKFHTSVCKKQYPLCYQKWKLVNIFALLWGHVCLSTFLYPKLFNYFNGICYCGSVLLLLDRFQVIKCVGEK